MADESKLSDVLAQKRTDLAAQRTVMAADRSLMAWVRTGLSLIGFGFSIYAFLQSLVEKNPMSVTTTDGPRRIGLILLAIGIICIVFGCLQDWAAMRSVKRIYPMSVWRFPLIIAALIGVVGIVLFIAVFAKIHVL